jgi:hypothetical protein
LTSQQVVATGLLWERAVADADALKRLMGG